jgi:hypothetical protein
MIVLKVRISWRLQRAEVCIHAVWMLPQVQSVVPDAALLQLLVAWLSPDCHKGSLPPTASLALSADATVVNVRPWKEGYEADVQPPPLRCCRGALGLPEAEGCPLAGSPGSCPDLDGAAKEDRAPLQARASAPLTAALALPSPASLQAFPRQDAFSLSRTCLCSVLWHEHLTALAALQLVPWSMLNPSCPGQQGLRHAALQQVSCLTLLHSAASQRDLRPAQATVDGVLKLTLKRVTPACAQHIAHVHAAIRSALDAFAAEAAALAITGGGGARSEPLAALVERLRFLRAVCTYHSASEDDVVFPAVRCAPFWPAASLATLACLQQSSPRGGLACLFACCSDAANISPLFSPVRKLLLLPTMAACTLGECKG